MKMSGKRLLCATVALVTVFSNMTVFAAPAQEGSDAAEVYASDSKQDIGDKTIRSNDEQEYLFFTGVKLNGTEAPVSVLNDDSIYRDGYQTLLTEDAVAPGQLTEAVPVFDLSSPDLTVLENGIVQESGASPADLSDTKDYTLYADGTGEYTGSRNYHLNVVPRYSGSENLYVIKSDERTINFDTDAHGREYFISLYNTGDEDLTGITAEITGASHIQIDVDSEINNAPRTIAPLFSGTGAVNAAPRIKLSYDGSFGSIGGTLNIYRDGRPIYSIGLSGYSYEGFFGRRSGSQVLRGSNVHLEDAVKWVPYSYKLNFGGQTVPSESITVSGLEENGWSYNTATQTIFGVPQGTGSVDFDVTVNGTASGDNFWTDDGTTKTYHVSFDILDNTDENVWNTTDPGYEVKKPVGEQYGMHQFAKIYHYNALYAWFQEMMNGTGTGSNNFDKDSQYSPDVIDAISKLEVYGAIPGANYFIADEAGNILYSWVSGGSSDKQLVGPLLKPNTVYYFITKDIPSDLEEWEIAAYSNAIGLSDTTYAHWLQPTDGREVDGDGHVIHTQADLQFGDIYRRARFVTAPMTRDSYVQAYAGAATNKTTGAEAPAAAEDEIAEAEAFFVDDEQAVFSLDEQTDTDAVSDYYGGGGAAVASHYLDDAIDVTNEVFVSWGEFDEFDDLYLNGRKLVENTDYYASEGSSVLEMLADCLRRNFQAGTNTLSATFTDANGQMHTSSQNIFVDKQPMDYGFAGYGAGSEDFESEDVEMQHREAARTEEINTYQQGAPGTTPVVTDKTDTDNADTGAAAKYAVSALLLLGASAAFTCAKKKRDRR